MRFLFSGLKAGEIGRGILTLQGSDELHWTVEQGQIINLVDEEGRSLYKDGSIISVPYY